MASVFLLIFLTFNLVAQFKAGGLIMRRASEGVQDTAWYRQARDATADVLSGTGAWQPETAAERASLHDAAYPDYVLGILIFAVTVVAYTAYGGFWAVTWTDVLQGILIVLGAVLLMVLALHAVGGLGEATQRLRPEKEPLLTGPGPDGHLPIGLAV